MRGEILRVSRELLDEGGPALLSMREVARRVGCTHQAPYYYFEDRETILAVLVVEGFVELTARLRSANALAPAHGIRAALIASTRSYVDFALAQAGVFRMMFRPDTCNPQRFPSIVQAARQARAELDALNTILHGAGATAARASVLWAHVHGLACLEIDGPREGGADMASKRSRELEDVAQTFADLVLGQLGSGGPERAVGVNPHL